MTKVNKVNIGRDEICNLLDGNSNLGVELGVALGDFSLDCLKSNKFKLLIGIDSYDLGQYGIEEYKKAIKKTKLYENKYKIIKMKFNEALDLFEDNSIDFIYFDGFAHNGQLGGKTIIDWYSKVKIGGIVSGDDYDDRWPLVKSAVNDIAMQLNVDLNITEIKKKNEYSEFPSWFFYKLSEQSIKINQSLIKKSIIMDKIETYFKWIFIIKKILIILLKKILPTKIIKIIKRSK